MEFAGSVEEKEKAKKVLSANSAKRKELFKMTIQPELYYQKLAEKRQYEILSNSGRTKLTEDEYYSILDEVEEEKKKIDAEPLVYFCPNLEQERMITAFVQSIRESKVSTVLITSANGTGKTTLSINLLGNLIFGVQNKWFDYPEIRRWQFPKQIWLITTPSNINSNYFSDNFDAASFNYWFKGKRFVPIKNGKNHITKISFPDRPDWNVDIYTYYQDLKEFESATVGIMVLDEPCPENIWRLLPARMRKGGNLFLPMTPLDCDPYIKDDIIDKANNNVKGYKHIEASAYSVTTDKERGHLDKDVLDGQIEKYSEDEVDARVFGRLMFFKERIIPNWNPAIHFVAPEKFPIKKDYLIYHIFDPADGRPNAEIWGALTPDGRRIVFGEMPLLNEVPFWEQKGGVPLEKHMLNVEFYESTLESQLGFPLKVKKRIVDYHFANQTRGTFKTNLLTDYRKAGWRLFESYKGVGEDELPYGHRKIIDALRIMPDGYPGLVIWNTCKHVSNAFEKYVRKRAKTEADLMKPANSGKIIEKYKDFMDVIRYFVCDSGRIFEIDEEVKQTTSKVKDNQFLHNIYNLF